jgi:hypothetical protein
MLVLVEDAAEAVVSADVKTCDARRIGDWWGRRSQWSAVGDALVRPMAVVEAFELSESVQ